MKVRVISSRDPDVHPDMIGDAEPFHMGFRVILDITRTTVPTYPVKGKTEIYMLPHEIEFVEPQISNEENHI